MSPEIGTRTLVRMQRSNGWDFGYIEYASYRSFSVLTLLPGYFLLFPFNNSCSRDSRHDDINPLLHLHLYISVNQLQPEQSDKQSRAWSHYNLILHTTWLACPYKTIQLWAEGLILMELSTRAHMNMTTTKPRPRLGPCRKAARISRIHAQPLHWHTKLISRAKP